MEKSPSWEANSSSASQEIPRILYNTNVVHAQPKHDEGTHIVTETIFVCPQDGKGKDHPIGGHEGAEKEQIYRSTLSLTSAPDEGSWSTPRPGRFTPRKETKYLLYRRLGGSQSWSERVRRLSPSPGFDPSTVQPVASHYTELLQSTFRCCTHYISFPRGYALFRISSHFFKFIVFKLRNCSL